MSNWNKLWRNSAVRLGCAVLAVLLLLAVLAPWLGTFDPSAMDPSFISVAAGTRGEVTLPDGQTLIMRTLDWDLGDGRHERVTVHWLLQEDGSLRYDFDRQPPETQEVHRRSCALQGMQPSRGVGMLSGEGTTHGYSCTSQR